MQYRSNGAKNLLLNYLGLCHPQSKLLLSRTESHVSQQQKLVSSSSTNKVIFIAHLVTLIYNSETMVLPSLVKQERYKRHNTANYNPLA